MIEDIEISHGKSVSDLGHEAFWFAAHTIIAVLVLVLTITVMTVTNPALLASLKVIPTSATDSIPDYITPKLIGTLLAFLMPLIAGFIIVRVKRNEIATYVWISGVLTFSVFCVWVIDLPTGPGLCEHCDLIERLWRTFFDIYHGSGLMGGDGLLVGAWIPLSMIGYAIGAKLGFDS